MLVTLSREMDELVQQFLQEFRTSTCFFFSVYGHLGFFVFFFSDVNMKEKMLCLSMSLMILLRMLQEHQLHLGFSFSPLGICICLYVFFYFFKCCLVFFLVV